MDWLRALLETSPMTALLLTIAAGYLVGEVNLKGFALGSGAVLFVGLACGAFAPKSAPPGMLGTLGLLLFLYCMGIQYGREWYRGLTSPEGLRANFAALCGLTAAAVASLTIYATEAASLPQALGMFAGSTTSTPTLQAILDALGNQDAAVGYSVTYPFGVAGPILCLYLYLALFKPKIESPPARRIQPVEISVRNAAWFGKPFPELQRQLPSGVQVAAIRDALQNRVPTSSTILGANDVLLVVGIDPVQIETARKIIGEGASSPAIAADRTDLDYIRAYASKRSVVGMPLGSLKIPGGFEYTYVQVRRGDTDLMPGDDLVLEFGDRVGVFCNRANFPAVRDFLGDSIKGTADFSYISVGVGAAVGLLAGMIPFPIPGVGRVTLGLAGVLLVALVLGTFRRTSGIVWTLPLSANLGTAQLRPHVVSGPGRDVVRPQVRRNHRGERIRVCPARRPDRSSARGRHHDRRTAAGCPDRRSVRRRVGSKRQPRYPGLREPRHSDRSARHRLRDDLSLDDHREDSFRAGCRCDFRGVNPRLARTRRRCGDRSFRVGLQRAPASRSNAPACSSVYSEIVRSPVPVCAVTVTRTSVGGSFRR